MLRLILFLSLLCCALSAQAPVFRIRFTLSGTSGEASYTSNLEIGYAPCALWTGGSGGWKGSPAGYLDEAGGLGGIRPA